MKKILAVIMLLTAGVTFYARANTADTIPAFIGITYVPSLKWYVTNIFGADPELLSYNFNSNTLSSYEGSIGIKRIGMRVGLSAQVDHNFVGKIQRYGGYVGLKSYWLRLQGSSISGSVDWAGETPVGSFSEYNFKNKFFSVELLKTFKKRRYVDGKWKASHVENQMGWYWGIGYSRISLPVMFATLTTPGGREHQSFGVSAYDTLFTGKYYTIGFGADLLRQLCLSRGMYSLTPGVVPKRFAMYASFLDRFGFGTGYHSKYAKEMGEALNPGKEMVSLKGFSSAIDYSLSIGFRYYIPVKPVFLVFAAGYDLDGGIVLNFGGPADTSTDLGYDSSFFFINHGFSVKIYISLIGRE